MHESDKTWQLHHCAEHLQCHIVQRWYVQFSTPLCTACVDNTGVNTGVCKFKISHTFPMFTKLTASLAACTTAVSACLSHSRMHRLPCMPSGILWLPCDNDIAPLTVSGNLQASLKFVCTRMQSEDASSVDSFDEDLLHEQATGKDERLCVTGIAKKQAEREQKVKEEAIASGMLAVKGSGKHKNRSNVDKGLVEDGGLFKAGMLRVKSTALGKSTSSKRKGPLSQRRAFSSGKIGNLDGNSQKAWNVASSQPVKKKGPSRKGRK